MESEQINYDYKGLNQTDFFCIVYHTIKIKGQTISWKKYLQHM